MVVAVGYGSTGCGIAGWWWGDDEGKARQDWGIMVGDVIGRTA